MTTTHSPQQILLPALLERLQRFRGELAELAFALELRGRLDAADAVNAVAARLAEIETEGTIRPETEVPS